MPNDQTNDSQSKTHLLRRRIARWLQRRPKLPPPAHPQQENIIQLAASSVAPEDEQRALHIARSTATGPLHPEISPSSHPRQPAENIEESTENGIVLKDHDQERPAGLHTTRSNSSHPLHLTKPPPPQPQQPAEKLVQSVVREDRLSAALPAARSVPSRLSQFAKLPFPHPQLRAENIAQYGPSSSALEFERPVSQTARSAASHPLRSLAFGEIPSLQDPLRVAIGEKPITFNPLTDAVSANRSFLEGAQHFQMGNLQYLDHVTVNLPSNVEYAEEWKILVQNMAPNALHNSHARYDAPKCDEDTRVEVIEELMDWIKDYDNPQCLLYMTGAAGAGKSSLQQTIAERCSKSGILGAAFFFSTTDPTRNILSTVIPTIAFQVGSHSLALKRYISAVIAQDPVIFERSLQAQMDSLLVRPLKELQERAELEIATLPHAIIIDGLDECKSEDSQEELLIAIRVCLLTNELPFRILIASRPEWAIRTALDAGGHLHKAAYHIQLNDKYDATEDMRRYLWRRFQTLNLRTGNPNWFTGNDIETLVQAGSGQFIYVATVFRYVSERRASPAERLKIILTWTPHEAQKTRPFEALDRLYTDILRAAKNAYEAVDSHSERDFLLLFKIFHADSTSGFPPFRTTANQRSLAEQLHLERGFPEILISDLHSLVTIEGTSGEQRLRFHHKSFSDFLNAETRAKDLFVPIAHVYAHLTKCCVQHIIQIESSSSSLLRLSVTAFPLFLHQSSPIDDEILIDFTRKDGWHKLDSLPLDWKYDYWYISTVPFLKNLQPDVLEVIRSFLDKWQRDISWERRRQKVSEPTRARW